MGERPLTPAGLAALRALEGRSPLGAVDIAWWVIRSGAAAGKATAANDSQTGGNVARALVRAGLAERWRQGEGPGHSGRWVYAITRAGRERLARERGG